MKIPVGPIDLLIIQGSSFCNIDCSYCYLPDRASTKKISTDTVIKSVQTLFDENLVKDEFSIVWHAGEPMAVKLPFYREIYERLKEITPEGIKIRQHIQTNATLINQEWCDFFKESGMIIGISCDGPQFIHDKFRLNRKGKGTFESTMKGVELLKKNDIPFSAIAVLTSFALDYPVEIYNFFKELGCRSLGFNIDEEDGVNVRSTIQSEQEVKLKHFWKTIYNMQLDAENYIHVREIFGFNEMFLKNNFEGNQFHLGQMLRPMKIISLDTDGNFSTFSPELLGMTDEKYGDFSLGNVNDSGYMAALETPKFKRMFTEIMAGIRMCKESCDYFDVCGGGAPSNKLYENGSFASTETKYCKYSRKIIVDSIVEKTEELLNV